MRWLTDVSQCGHAFPFLTPCSASNLHRTTTNPWSAQRPPGLHRSEAPVQQMSVEELAQLMGDIAQVSGQGQKQDSRCTPPGPECSMLSKGSRTRPCMIGSSWWGPSAGAHAVLVRTERYKSESSCILWDCWMVTWSQLSSDRQLIGNQCDNGLKDQ